MTTVPRRHLDGSDHRRLPVLRAREQSCGPGSFSSTAPAALRQGSPPGGRPGSAPQGTWKLRFISVFSFQSLLCSLHDRCVSITRRSDGKARECGPLLPSLATPLPCLTPVPLPLSHLPPPHLPPPSSPLQASGSCIWDELLASVFLFALPFKLSGFLSGL